MLKQSSICDFGWQAPPFSLANPDGIIFSLNQMRGKNGTLVAFICNHCPYVKEIIGQLVTDAEELKLLGVNTLAVMSNNYIQYPDDAPAKMKEFAKLHNFDFPYLVDGDRQVAKSWDAICTPDFFGLNADLQLQYRGRITPKDDPLKRELFEAMKMVSETGKGPQNQSPSMGCSIKW